MSAFHYMNFYLEMLQITKASERCPLKAKRPTVVTIYDQQICRDLMASILTVNSIINQINGFVSLNRIGSNPLEHKFGLLRIRSKYKNSITKLFNEASKVEIMNHIEKSVFFDVVNRRKNTFGELLNLDGDYHGGSSIFSYVELWL